MRQGQRSTVAVVIPCFNQRRFLTGAIDSAVRQSTPPDEIVVVDDGSKGDLTKVTGSYPGVRLIRQENRGLAGARNTGLKAATSEKIIFLDADDRLLPEAISAGLDCFRENPDAAFVYGGYREVSRHSTETCFTPVNSHRDLVRTNWIGMVATVMFDRAKLLDRGGFDETLGMCEDWDAYLRLSRDMQFAAHPTIVADYIRHLTNASNDVPRLREWIEVVRAREWDRGLGPEDQMAWHEGAELWRSRVPDPVTRSPVRRAARKAARLVARALRR